MRNLILGLTLGIMASSLPADALAQNVDEIVVTGSRITRIANSSNGGPGVTLVKRGDFLLLEVLIESDARDLDERLTEIKSTLGSIIEAAEADPSIELSIISSERSVRKLNTSNYLSGLEFGGRPDTSLARIRVKTAIPDTVENSAELATKLSRFVDGIEETGRITISTAGETAVSVVDPFRYRDEVVAMIVEEVNAITDALGPEYVAMIEGLDRQVYWDRKGDIELAFSLPYSYRIIPNTLHSIQDYED